MKLQVEDLRELLQRRQVVPLLAISRQSKVFDQRWMSDRELRGCGIGKATEAQRRFWLLGAEGLRADRNTGRIKFHGNEYWDNWMGSISAQRVVIRFDPANLWSGLHVFSTDNAYLGHATCQVKAGFLDVDAARTLSKKRSAWMKAQRAEPSPTWGELAAVLAALKGRFILSLKDIQGVRETFAAFRFEEVKTTYTIGAKGAQPERAEVLIANWDLRPTP